MQRRFAVPLAMISLLAGWAIDGCSPSAHPVAPSREAIGTWPPALKEMLELVDGRWPWRWQRVGAGPGPMSGTARLEIDGARFRWLIAGAGADRAATDSLVLTPAAGPWLPIRVADPAELATTPPLPHLPLDSPAYPDLVAMLRELTTPRFGAVVTRWSGHPVAVGAPVAVSGEVDLAACLREAVELWNAGEPDPLFAWDPAAGWGVRLAHYAGSIRSPALQIQVTRHDGQSRILAMRIATGDNYASAASRPHAVRGLAHELGHALMLWGHSPDREHLLWGAAPPARAEPSRDERRAVRLLLRLPEGLDLRRYGPRVP